MKVKGKGKGAEGGEGCSLLIGESEFGNGGGEEGKRARGAKFGAFRHFFFHFKHRAQFLHSRTAGKLTWRLTKNTPKLLVVGASRWTHWRNLQHSLRPLSWWIGGLPPLPKSPTPAQSFGLRAHLAPAMSISFQRHCGMSLWNAVGGVLSVYGGGGGLWRRVANQSDRWCVTETIASHQLAIKSTPGKSQLIGLFQTYAEYNSHSSIIWVRSHWTEVVTPAPLPQALPVYRPYRIWP